MGLDVFEAWPQAQDRLQQAHEVLGWQVEALCAPERKDDLPITLYTQPALYCLSVIYHEILREKGVAPSYVAGHSAGEYAALTAAGSWDFATGLRVIAKRAELMHNAQGEGGMAAVLGLDPQVISEVCEACDAGHVAIANYNSPKQTVISGDKAAVDAVVPLLKEKKAKRVVPLPVSGAFHSVLMRQAQDEFRAFMDEIRLEAPSALFVSNNQGVIVVEPAEIKSQLVRQFCEPVRWVDCMNVLAVECSAAVEVGPGNVLTGLARQCTPDLPCLKTDTWEGIEQVVQDESIHAE